MFINLSGLPLTMYDQFRSLFRGVIIKEVGNEIIINGVSGKALIRDINKHWKTTKIASNFFNVVTGNRITFYKFFAPEFMYLLDGVAGYRSRFTSLKMINSLKSHMLEHTWLKGTETQLPGRLDFKRLNNMVFTPEDYQMEYFKDYDVRLNKYGLKGDLVDAATGVGKALSVNSPVKTPNGWKAIGALRVNQQITAIDGTTTKVTGVYPQGIKSVYKVTFRDGRSAECCLDHLWKVYIDGKAKVLDTRDLANHLEAGVRPYIDLVASQIDGNDSERTVMYNGTTEGRLAVLSEMFKQHGSVVEGSNKPFFKSGDLDLAKNLQMLVRSLGGISKLYSTRDGVYNTYRVTIDLPKHLTIECDTHTLSNYHLDSNTLEMVSIAYSHEYECVCISVEHASKLFITTDYIVTHNTYITTAIAEMLGSDLIVVICPKEALELVWVPSIDEMYKTKQTVWTSSKLKPYNGERFILCHYNALDKLSMMLQDPKVYKGKKVTTILDESHNMNTIDSARTKMYLDVVATLNSDNNMLASGTAVKALGIELLPLLRVVDPMFTKPVEERFRKAYGATASKGLDIIRFRLGLISFKIEKKVLEMDPPIMKPYPIAIPNGADYTLPEIKKDMVKFIEERFVYYKARRANDDLIWKRCLEIHQSKLKTSVQHQEFKNYLSLVKMISSNPNAMDVGEEIKQTNLYEKNHIEPTLPRDLIKDFRDVKSVIKYTHLKIQGECLGRILGGKRISCHVDMVPHIDWVGMIESTAKKTVMFTSFVEALEAAQTHILKIGLQPLTVYGKNKSDMVENVGKFDKNPKLNPMLATYMSLSTGVRLTIADTIILLNTPFRQYILEQAIARAYRKGQDSQVVVYKITLDTGDIPNISTRSDDILKWSTEQVAAILGVGNNFTDGDTVNTFEAFKYDMALTNVPDENELMYEQLERMFKPYDIEISKEQFRTPPPTKAKQIPFYLQ